MQDVFVGSSLGRVHLRTVGSGPLLFLMHSAGRSAYEFDALATLLAADWRVAAWDMPGHGDSGRTTRFVSIADHADLAVEIASGLGVGRPVLGGGSVGAAIALAAAARHPDRLAGILPIELPLSRDGAWWARHWGMVEAMFASPDEPEERSRARYRDWSPELAQRLRIDRHKAGSHEVMQLLWAGREDADATEERVRGLAVPSLFVNGDKGVAPEAGEVLPLLNPAARLAVIADAGHFPHTDDPAAVASAIAAGLTRA